MMKKKEAEKKLPRGVSFDKSHRGTKKYKTRVFWNGKDRFVGRFATIEQAEAAYQQANATFRRSHPDSCEETELLARVRALVHVADDTETVTDATDCCPDASEATHQQQQHPNRLQQLQGAGRKQPSSTQHSGGSSSSPQHDDANAGAGAGLLASSCPTTAAAAAAALSGMQLESCWGLGAVATQQQQQPCYVFDEGVLDMADLLLEELLAGDVPAGLMRMSSSCTDLAAAAAHIQQQQQQQRAAYSCPLPPLHGCFAPAAAAAAAAVAPPALAPSAPLAFVNSAAQQQQQDPEAELQFLLDKILQGAGQLDAPNAPTAAELHERALQQCCDEFLLATTSPALSAPPACGYYPAASQQQQQQQQRACFNTLSGPPAAAASAAGRTSLELTSCDTAVLRPAGLARQGSLLLQADRCQDAVLYVSAVAQAVLDLSSSLLPRRFDANAAGDLAAWLRAFPQRQQVCGPAALAAAVAAAAGSPGAAADLELLNASVMEVVEKMVAVLRAAASSPAAMPAQSSNTGSTLASSTGSSCAAAGSAGRATNNAAGQVVSRPFVLAVLGRLNLWLAGLHGILQQQAAGAARPAAMWQKVQCWMRQLQAEAAAPEDFLALQLAALL